MHLTKSACDCRAVSKISAVTGSNGGNHPVRLGHDRSVRLHAEAI